MNYVTSDAVKNAVKTAKDLDAVKKIFDYIKADDENSIKETVELAMIEAPTHHEEKKCARLVEKFKEYGLTDVRVGNAGNCIAVRPGKGNTGKYVVIDGHMDTVFPFGTVKEPVYKDGAIYLQGIQDDTRALATELAILRALNDAGVETEHDLLFLGTVCEEGMGSMAGMKAFVEEFGAEKIAALIGIDGDDPWSIVYGATGISTDIITFKGVGGHAYVDFGRANCLHAASRAISMISDIEVSKDPKTTYCVSNFHAGTPSAAHVIVDNCSIIINFRSESPELLADLEKKIYDCVQKACDIENERAGTPGVVTWSMERVCDVPAGSQDIHNPVIEAAYETMKSMNIEPQFVFGGNCNSNFAIANDIPAITIGCMYRDPGFKDSCDFHNLNEHLYIKNSHITVQQTALMALVNAGIHGVIDPISK